MKYDEILDVLAGRQHGVVTRQQLLAAGLPSSCIDYRLVTGRLCVRHAGVYAVRGQSTSFEGELMAAVLAAGPRAVASHRAAGFLHGLGGVPARAEITVPLIGGAAPTGVVVHRSRDMPRAEVVHGVPCTKIARTLIDLAAVLPPADLADSLDDALTRRLVTCTYLQSRLSDAAGRERRSFRP